jgi:hypothetical protein
VSEDIEVLLKIGSRYYEGRLRPQVGHPTEISNGNPPAIPEILAELLTIKAEGDYWILRPRQFLKKQDFSEIARIVRQYKGDYVSAGRSSYFKIPK